MVIDIMKVALKIVMDEGAEAVGQYQPISVLAYWHSSKIHTEPFDQIDICSLDYKTLVSQISWWSFIMLSFDQPSKLGATHVTNKQKIWFFLKFSCLCLYRDILFPNFYSRALCGMLIKEKRNREATINQNFYRKLLLSCLLSPHHFFLRTWNLRKMVFLVLFHISSPPVISGDETLQQCPLQNLYLDFWISEDFVLRLVTGKWERIVKFMLFGAGHKFLR